MSRHVGSNETYKAITKFLSNNFANRQGWNISKTNKNMIESYIFPQPRIFCMIFQIDHIVWHTAPFWALKKCRKELEQNISAFLWDKDENYWWEDGALRCHIINQRILRWKSSKLMHQKVSYLIQMHWWKKVSRWI